MSHQPPVPEASTSPYPLQPAPIPEEVKLAAAAAEAEAEAEIDLDDDEEEAVDGGLSARMIGVGAAIGLGAAAAVTGLLYARRRPTSAGRKAASGKATSGKGKKSGDDKQKRGKADRARVAADEPYEVSYFARKHKISADEARAIIKKAGPDREAANALAKRRKKK